MSGPQDYREWYRSLPTQQCQSQKFDVPESCCTGSTQASTDTSIEISNDNRADTKTNICDRNGTDWLEQLVTIGGNDTLTIEQKCDSTNNQTFQIDRDSSQYINANVSLSNTIPLCDFKDTKFNH